MLISNPDKCIYMFWKMSKLRFQGLYENEEKNLLLVIKIGYQ